MLQLKLLQGTTLYPIYYRDGHDLDPLDLEKLKHSTYDIGQACTYATEMVTMTVPKCDPEWKATMCLSKYKDTGNDKLSVVIKITIL